MKSRTATPMMCWKCPAPVFDRFELDDISFMNEVDRHYEQSEQTEQSLNRRIAQSQESVEETVFQRVEIKTLRQAIAKLPEKQRTGTAPPSLSQRFPAK